MGDLFGQWVPNEWILKVIDAVRKADSSNTFLFLTKNPARYHNFVDLFTNNCILGATIETNRDEGYEKFSKAPKPSERYKAMKVLNYPRKFLSVEPLMDFDINEFFRWIQEIKPEACAIGYDNYGHKLSEPSLSKTMEFVKRKRALEISVCEKNIRPAWWEDGILH